MRAHLTAALMAASLLSFVLSASAHAAGLFGDVTASVGRATAAQQSRVQQPGAMQNLFGKPQPKPQQQTWGIPRDNAKANCLSMNYDLYAERRAQNDARTDSWKKAGAYYNEQRFKEGQQRCMQ